MSLAGAIYDGTEARSRYKHKDESRARLSYRRVRKQHNAKSSKPNIIVVMTDDQDEILGKSFISFRFFFCYFSPKEKKSDKIQLHVISHLMCILPDM